MFVMDPIKKGNVDYFTLSATAFYLSTLSNFFDDICKVIHTVIFVISRSNLLFMDWNCVFDSWSPEKTKNNKFGSKISRNCLCQSSPEKCQCKIQWQNGLARFMVSLTTSFTLSALKVHILNWKIKENYYKKVICSISC